MIDWKPIETAPKDRRVLLFFTRDAPWGIQCGKWSENRDAKKPRPYWAGDMCDLLGKRWARANPPTHWAEINEPDEGSFA